MAEIIALIPARSGSKGVKNKNVRMLGGHPLIAWSIMAARKSRMIDRIIVSTDSSDYAKIALEYGAEVPFLRPPEISGDTSTDYDCIVHTLDWLSKNSSEPKYIVHLRPTTPIRDPLLIANAIVYFKKSENKFTALRSAHEMSESAYKNFEINHDGRFKKVGCEDFLMDYSNNARQSYPLTFQPNGYVDILSTSFIRQRNLIHGDWVLPFITPITLEVDTEYDFSLLEYQLINEPSVVPKLFHGE